MNEAGEQFSAEETAALDEHYKSDRWITARWKPHYTVKTSDVKRDLATHALRKGARAVTSEASHWWNADIVVLDRHSEIVEYEIKVNESDLRSELDSITRALRYNGDYENRVSYMTGLKGFKHLSYLWPESYDNEYPLRRPNYFYFCVPDYLIHVCLRVITGTPYGLINASALNDLKNAVVRKPTALHQDAPTYDDILHFSVNLSRKYWYGKKP